MYPVDNKSSTDYLHQFANKQKNDPWNVAHDTLHMTQDRWQKLCNNFGSLAVMAWDFWCFKDLEEKDRLKSVNLLINHIGVCRTAPDTPGLLKISTPPKRNI